MVDVPKPILTKLTKQIDKLAQKVNETKPVKTDKKLDKIIAQTKEKKPLVINGRVIQWEDHIGFIFIGGLVIGVIFGILFGRFFI